MKWFECHSEWFELYSDKNIDEKGITRLQLVGTIFRKKLVQALPCSFRLHIDTPSLTAFWDYHHFHGTSRRVTISKATGQNFQMDVWHLPSWADVKAVMGNWYILKSKETLWLERPPNPKGYLTTYWNAGTTLGSFFWAWSCNTLS